MSRKVKGKRAFFIFNCSIDILSEIFKRMKQKIDLQTNKTPKVVNNPHKRKSDLKLNKTTYFRSNVLWLLF